MCFVMVNVIYNVCIERVEIRIFVDFVVGLWKFGIEVDVGDIL